MSNDVSNVAWDKYFVFNYWSEQMLNHTTHANLHMQTHNTQSFGMVSVAQILIYKKVQHHGFRHHIAVSRFIWLSYAVNTSED